MIMQILKISEVKKDPTCLIGLDIPAAVTKHGSVVAYVVSPELMDQLTSQQHHINCECGCGKTLKQINALSSMKEIR